MPDGAVKRVEAAIRRVLPPAWTAAVRRTVLRRRAVLHSLEFHVTDHCNLNCKGCGHFSCISPVMFADPQAFGRDMTRLAEIMDDIEVITLLGGEPLLHPAVLDFVESARRAFPRAQVHLTTNGILLGAMPESFWDKLATERVRVNISGYPIKIDDEAIRREAERSGVEVVRTVAREQSYCIPLDSKGASRPADSRAACLTLANCPFLRDGRIYPCAYPPLVFAVEERFGLEFPVQPADSIDIHGDIDGFAVNEFLARSIAFCRFCDLGRVRDFAWGRSSRSLDEWT